MLDDQPADVVLCQSGFITEDADADPADRARLRGTYEG